MYQAAVSIVVAAAGTLGAHCRLSPTVYQLYKESDEAGRKLLSVAIEAASIYWDDRSSKYSQACLLPSLHVRSAPRSRAPPVLVCPRSLAPLSCQAAFLSSVDSTLVLSAAVEQSTPSLVKLLLEVTALPTDPALNEDDLLSARLWIANGCAGFDPASAVRTGTCSGLTIPLLYRTSSHNILELLRRAPRRPLLPRRPCFSSP